MVQLKSLSFIWIVLSLWGCSDIESPKPTIQKSDSSPFVWSFERTKKGSYCNSFIHNESLITGMQSDDPNNRGFSLFALSLDSGKLLWQNDDFDPSFNPFDHEYMKISNDVVVLSRGKLIYAVDANTGKSLWQDILKYGDYNITIIDNWVYKNTFENRVSSSLYRYNLHSGKKEHLFTIHKDQYGSGYSPAVYMPVKWNHPSGDEILILQNKTYGWFTDMKSKMDILGYNLSADSILWYVDGLDSRSPGTKPLIEDDRVYFFGFKHAYCINPINGSVKWKFHTGNDPEGDFNTANILTVGNTLIVKPDSRWMHGVNKYTGEAIWLNKNTRAMPDMLQEQNDTIWFAIGAVVAVDAKTGAKLIDWNNNGNGWWSAPVTPHPNNGNIYTTDGNYVYCIDPNKLK